MQAAGNDRIKMIEVGAYVQCQTVHGDIFSDTHANSTKFGFVRLRYPNTASASITPRFDAKMCNCVNYDLFEPVDVSADIEAEQTQPKNGIRDKLARAMISYIATSIGRLQMQASQ